MGWGRTLLLGDIGNRLDIGDCEQDIGQLRSHMQQQRRVHASHHARIRALERENDELKLYVASIVRILIARSVVTKDEFARFVDIIDRSDGTPDGRYGGDIEA